jgi:cell division inhibitor SulA/protein ImuA
VDRDDLASLLGRHVWRGGAGQVAQPVIPTGFAELDRVLPSGGWPQGALIELYAEGAGSGELSLLMPAIVRLSLKEEVEEKKWIAWIAPPLIPYAPALRRCGVNIDRLLMIRPSRGRDAERTSTRDCLWAVEQVIRSGSSSGVLAWLPPTDSVALRRLQLAAEAQGCWTVLFRERAAQAKPSPAALRIRLRYEHEAVRVDVLKCRGGQRVSVDVTAALANVRQADPCVPDAPRGSP